MISPPSSTRTRSLNLPINSHRIDFFFLIPAAILLEKVSSMILSPDNLEAPVRVEPTICFFKSIPKEGLVRSDRAN